jgi:hypothetical protein
MENLDRNRIEALAADLMAPIKENYQLGPISRDRAYEALNALAIAAAVVIMGCDGPQGDAHLWFQTTLEKQLNEWPPSFARS